MTMEIWKSNKILLNLISRVKFNNLSSLEKSWTAGNKQKYIEIYN